MNIDRGQPPDGVPSPIDFYDHLVWLDGRPLLETMQDYRIRLHTDALYTFDATGRPTYNQVLDGRAKKNFKTTDLVLAALYRFLIWPSSAGNDCFLLANDEGQAKDDLVLATKLLEANPILAHEVDVRAKELVRQDGHGSMKILPAQDVAGSHGKTFLFVGFDEIHAYRSWDIFEALAPDPTRLDALTWITSYATAYNAPGIPLCDLVQAGKRGDDPRLLFSWYAADFTTDPAFEDAEPEQRANPSMSAWGNPDYLEQQRRRLPTHQFRRLHLNLPGAPEGAFFDGDMVMRAIVSGRKQLPRDPDLHYVAFVDMAGGGKDDSCLAIAHRGDDRLVLDLVVNQGRKPPYNPRQAIKTFAGILEGYGIFRVVGDRYAGETFRQDFLQYGVSYEACSLKKSELYEALEPRLNAGEVELLDLPKLQEQLLTLVMRGNRIDHQSGDHDDWANAAAGAIHLAAYDMSLPDWAKAEALGSYAINGPDSPINIWR